MKWLIKSLFSLFFAISIGVHIYYVIESDHKPLWWHMLYFISYGVCWRMLFSKIKKRSLVYAAMALFPFISHLYYGYNHRISLDGIFWVCLLVCVILPLGFGWIKYEEKLSNDNQTV